MSSYLRILAPEDPPPTAEEVDGASTATRLFWDISHHKGTRFDVNDQSQVRVSQANNLKNDKVDITYDKELERDKSDISVKNNYSNFWKIKIRLIFI